MWIERYRASIAAVGAALCVAAGLLVDTASARQSPEPQSAASAVAVPTAQILISKYCIGCHNERTRTGGLVLDSDDLANPGNRAEVWEKVVEKLRAGSMPPPGRPRPDKDAYAAAASQIEAALDAAWATRPDPGRIGAVHRL